MRILLVDGDKSEGVVFAGQLSERGHDVASGLPTIRLGRRSGFYGLVRCLTNKRLP